MPNCGVIGDLKCCWEANLFTLAQEAFLFIPSGIALELLDNRELDCQSTEGKVFVKGSKTLRRKNFSLSNGKELLRAGSIKGKKKPPARVIFCTLSLLFILLVVNYDTNSLTSHIKCSQ